MKSFVVFLSRYQRIENLYLENCTTISATRTRFQPLQSEYHRRCCQTNGSRLIVNETEIKTRFVYQMTKKKKNKKGSAILICGQ